MRFNNRDDIIALTPQWKGERFPDGRPKVPDKYLDELRKLTLDLFFLDLQLLNFFFVHDFNLLTDIKMDRKRPPTFFSRRSDLRYRVLGLCGGNGLCQQTVSAAKCAGIDAQASQGAQLLVRNEVTQNSPGI